MKAILFIVLGVFTSAFTEVDENPNMQFWIFLGKDSASIYTDYSRVMVPALDVLRKTRDLDSLWKTRDGFEEVLNFYIGKCDNKKIKEFTRFFKKNKMTVSAIGCGEKNKKVKIFRTGINLPIPFSDSAFVNRFRKILDEETSGTRR